MEWTTGDEPVLKGHEGTKTVTITWSFPDGIQGRKMMSEGHRYRGTSRTGYLPDTPTGRAIAQMFIRCFEHGHMFTVGSSVTTGAENTTVWNGVHVKTKPVGGSANFGYPDDGYFKRVLEELAGKHILPTQEERDVLTAQGVIEQATSASASTSASTPATNAVNP